MHARGKEATVTSNRGERSVLVSERQCSVPQIAFKSLLRKHCVNRIRLAVSRFLAFVFAVRRAAWEAREGSIDLRSIWVELASTPHSEVKRQMAVCCCVVAMQFHSDWTERQEWDRGFVCAEWGSDGRKTQSEQDGAIETLGFAPRNWPHTLRQTA